MSEQQVKVPNEQNKLLPYKHMDKPVFVTKSGNIALNPNCEKLVIEESQQESSKEKNPNE